MTAEPDAIDRSPRGGWHTWRHRHRWTVRLVVTATLLAALTLFAAANFVLIELRLVFWNGDVRLSWGLLGAGAIGFLLGLLVPRLLR